MIAFDTTTRKLQFVLSAPKTTNNSPWTSHWQDGETGPVQALFGNTSGVTAVDVVPAPAALANGSRRLRFVSLSNQDTAAITVTVQYVDTSGGVSTHILTVVTLAQGETLMYEEGAGWISTDTTGSLKQVSNATIASQALSTAQLVSSLASSASLGLLPSVSSQASSLAAAETTVSSQASSMAALSPATVSSEASVASVNQSLGSSAGWSTTISKVKSSFLF